MYVVNVMFSRILGGIEQCFFDYSQALLLSGHKVICLINKNAPIKEQLLKLNVEIIEISNLGKYDLFAKYKIEKICRKLAANAIIAHGNRAISLTKKCRVFVPVIAVAHNYSLKYHPCTDATIAITEDLKQQVILAGQKKSKVYKLPNMINITKTYRIRQKNSKNNIIIGTMGRFVPKKGFNIFILALAELVKQQPNLYFKAIIGGDGAEKKNLITLANKLGLSDKINFTGWIKDKKNFFDNIDIFCLPSLNEPFGIILLEAFMHKVPVISSNTTGPLEISKNNHDALLFEKGNYVELAQKISMLANDKNLGQKLVANALTTLERYDINNVCKALDNIVQDVVRNYQNTALP